MAGRIEDILHDYLDNIEDLSLATRRKLRRLIASLDPLRLADPLDVDYDALVFEGLYDIAAAAMAEAYAEGKRTMDIILGMPGLGRGLGAVLGASLGILGRSTGLLESRFGLLETDLTLFELRMNDITIELGAKLGRLINAAQASGMNPDVFLDALERALRAFDDPAAPPGPPGLVGPLRALAGPEIEGAIQSAGRSGQLERTGEHLGVEELESMELRWVCALVNTCPDCLTRHGEFDTLANWKSRGMPGAGWSVCEAQCKCQLISSELVGSTEITPLVRIKETKTGLTVRAPDTLLQEAHGSTRWRAIRKQALELAFKNDIRVRRAFRELGRLNAD